MRVTWTRFLIEQNEHKYVIYWRKGNEKFLRYSIS